MDNPIHIDGDILIYRAAWATENEVFWAAQIALDNMVEKILDVFPDCSSAVHWLTASDRKFNFRYYDNCSVEYKDRKQPRPTHYHALRRYYQEKYSARVVYGCEADDVLGWHKAWGFPIATIDKDLKMVPGLQYDIVKGTVERHTPLGEVVYETAKQSLTGKAQFIFSGFKGFAVQLITGDKSDTIPGLPYNGLAGTKSNKCPSRCVELFADCTAIKEVWETVQKVYKDEGCTDQYFYEQVRLLWIERYPGNRFPTEEQLNEA